MNGVSKMIFGALAWSNLSRDVLLILNRYCAMAGRQIGHAVPKQRKVNRIIGKQSEIDKAKAAANTGNIVLGRFHAKLANEEIDKIV